MDLMKSLPRVSLLLAACTLLPPLLAANRFLVYVGTYTGQSSKGIYAYRFDADTGDLQDLGLAAAVSSPSFLAVSPNRRFLYAVDESVPGSRTGEVSAFAIDAGSGKLTLLNQVSSKGSGPCHLAVDHTGKMLVVANYSSGSVASYPIQADGRLGDAASFIQHTGSSVNPARQKGPHAHDAVFSPDNRFVLVADLGLDQIKIYRADPAKATLTANEPAFGTVPPGAGPRHMAFHPNQRFLYVIDEMGSSITAMRWDGRRGALSQFETVSTLPKGYDGKNNTGAEVAIDQAGRFLYGSNRGHDSIAVFAVNAAKGSVTPLEQVPTQGKEPRNFALDPTGKYLFAANQNSDNVVLFHVDGKTGRLSPAGKSFHVGKPVCVTFVAE